MQRMNGNDARIDAAYSLLGNARRRYLLYRLADAEYVTVDALVDQILEWNGEDDPSEESRRRVHVSLVHNHLPRLADHDVVEYDLRSGDVVASEGFEELAALLEQFRRTEDVEEIRELAPL